MIFRRSDDGISNYTHFLQVDYLVLIEGKTDSVYWQTMFENHRPDLKVDFQKRDGVENLADVSAAIANGTVHNTLVCRDADYEVLRGTLGHSKIIHTYGYSFENDFISPTAASLVVSLLADKPISKPMVERAFRMYVAKLARMGNRLLALDIAYGLSDQNILVRTNPKHMMCEGRGGHLYFSRDEINARLSSVRVAGKRRKLPQGQLGALSPIFPRYYCGHSMFFVFMEWCKRIARRFSKNIPNSSNGLIKNFLLSHYGRAALIDAQAYMSNRLSAI